MKNNTTKTWHDIWAGKNAQINKNTEANKILEQLFVLTGFDSKSSSAISVENYRKFVSETFKWADLQTCDSLYEVGCGAGVFLYAMELEKALMGGGQQQMNSGFARLGGIDYAKNLCAIAQSVLPHAHIVQMQAKDFDTNPQYDCVASFGVFHYFENLNYAKEVIYKMIAKAKKKVLFLDILDSKKRDEDKSYKIKAYGEEEYKKLYEGETKHLYYEKSFFREIAHDLNLKCDIKDQNITGYKNSSFRFNCAISKEKL